MMLANGLEVLYNNLPVREDSAAWYFSQAFYATFFFLTKKNPSANLSINGFPPARE